MQCVLSRTVARPCIKPSFESYETLREINPSPYCFYFDFGTEKLFGASNEVLDFFNSKNRDDKSFSSGSNSIFKSIGYENGLRDTLEKSKVKQIQIQTLESMLADQILCGQEAKDTSRYVKQLKKQLNQPYDLSKPNDISTQLSTPIQTQDSIDDYVTGQLTLESIPQNTPSTPYEPVILESRSNDVPKTQYQTSTTKTQVLEQKVATPTYQAAQIKSNNENTPSRRKSLYSRLALTATAALVAGCTMLSS